MENGEGWRHGIDQHHEESADGDAQHGIGQHRVDITDAGAQRFAAPDQRIRPQDLRVVNGFLF